MDSASPSAESGARRTRFQGEAERCSEPEREPVGEPVGLLERFRNRVRHGSERLHKEAELGYTV
jgi:hypothetical protein